MDENTEQVETQAEPVEQKEEIVVTIGEENPDEAPEEHQPAPEWVKKLRQQNREQTKELRELRQKLNTPQVSEPELGKKPTLIDADYDAEKYEADLEKWYERKRKADEKAAAKAAEEAQLKSNWDNKLSAFNASKENLGVSDFEDAELVILDLLNPTQQGIIVQGAKDPALVIYAIGKNETEAKALAAIKDPVEFAFAVARLEGQLKVTSKKPATAPETRVSGNSRPSGSTDSTLARLRTEAEKTGDFSKVIAYKRQKRG